jgi:uncharacterized protein YdaU (DUF1376 family)
MHYYQFHIGDYMSHTRHLSIYEDLAYRRLLDFYFLHEQPIKHRDVARQIGMREHEEDVLTVLNEFFLSTPEGFVNPRADKEIQQYKEYSEAGKRGAAKRWGTPPNGEAISPPNAPPIATNNHKPITNNHKPKKEKATVVACPDFVEQQVWDDFLSIRKAKNAPMSKTALKAIELEAKKAGWSLNTAISESVSRGWQSFKAEWVKEKLNQSEQRQNTMNQLTRGLSTPKTPFWAKPETTILEAENVEQTRLL